MSARINPNSFDKVLDWMTDISGTEALAAHTMKIAESLATTRDVVRNADLSAVANMVTASLNALRPAVSAISASLPADSPQKARLDAAIGVLGLEELLARLNTNRARYLAALERAASFSQTLRSTGFSEADLAIAGLSAAFDPLRLIVSRFKQVLDRLGISGFDDGLPGVLRQLFESASPSRLAQLTAPIFLALKGRIQTLIEAILTPILAGISDLQNLIQQFDLAPLRQALDGIVQQVKTQINSLNPLDLLKPELDAFKSLQQDVAGFDPLASLVTVLNALRDMIPRVIAKLSAEKLLEVPLAIYDAILQTVRKLELGTLLEPVLDQLDLIAKQVNEGLDATVTSFERLQQALPSGGGGSSASASASIA
jgi:hypothetical protein